MRTWRLINVFKDKALGGDTGKETFSLPRTHMIGDLFLTVRAKNSTTGNICDGAEYKSIEQCLTKIKIKSGSRTFKDYDGIHCRLMAGMADGRTPPQYKSMEDDVVQESTFPIHFGIEPQDEDVILPAPLLDSLDMVLEYTFPTSAGAGFVTGTTYKTFDLYASVLEPTADLEDKMILIQEKKRDFTPAGSGDTPYDLTLDERRLLRRIYVGAYVTATREGGVIENLKVKADNEEVLDIKWRALQHMNAVDHKITWHEGLETLGAADGTYLSRIPDVDAQFTQITSGESWTSQRSGDVVGIKSAGADQVGYLRLSSDVLPGVAVVDFDRDNSLRRLQPQGIRDLDLILHDDAAGAGQIYEESLQKIW